MPRLIVLLILFLSGCATTVGQRVTAWVGGGSEATQPLILISIDGFHPDYLDRGLTPTLQGLADDGVRARWLQPSFPSKTFPNHYSIVTGLVPDHHGIVDNHMVDAQLGRFDLKDRAAVGDGRWWGGEPIWVGAQRAGLRTATLFWPGSEAAIAGVRPDDWRPFDATVAAYSRVDQVLVWLDRGPRRRPHFITLYFDQLDAAGHSYGPESPEVDAALAVIDSALRRLIDGLRARDLSDSNLVILSDHGMAELLPERELILEDLIDPTLVEIVGLTEIVSLQPRPGRAAAVEAALLPPGRAGIDCYRKQELPPAWNYGSHARVPGIVCQLHEGWRIRRRERFNPHLALLPPRRGAHGYDPQAPSMRALFVAHGPAFRQGLLVEPFHNIHVYPLLAHLLGIAPAANDGDPTVTAPLLRSQQTAPSATTDQRSVQP